MSAIAARARKLRYKIKPWRMLSTIFLYLTLSGLAFVFAFPFIYMIITSLMTNSDLVNAAVNWIPTSIMFENYIIAWELLNYWRFFQNSVIVTIVPTIGHVLVGAFIGYGFARFEFPGKKILFGFVILSMVVPVQTIIVPLFLTYARWDWLNTRLPLIVPAYFGYGVKGGMFIFLFRQFFIGLPKDLENAAKIDGCGFLRTYFYIVFPLAKAAILVVTVLSVVWRWNEFYQASIFAGTPALAVLPSQISVLASMTGPDAQEIFDILLLEIGEDVLNDATIMAGVAMIIAPILIFFTIAQSQFMKGIERTGITGE